MTIRQFVIAIAALPFGFVAHLPQAAAALTVTASVGGAPTSSATHRASFEDLALGAGGGTSGGLGVSLAGGALAVSGGGFGYTAPYLSAGNGALFGDATTLGFDGTQYLSTLLGTVTLSLPQRETYLGLLWGSVDSFNTLSFYDGGALVGRVTGADITSNSGSVWADGTFY